MPDRPGSPPLPPPPPPAGSPRPPGDRIPVGLPVGIPIPAGYARRQSRPQAPVAYTSGLAAAAVAISSVVFVMSWIPYVGFLGAVGLLLALADLYGESLPGHRRSKGAAITAIILGCVAILAAIVWLIIISEWEEWWRTHPPHWSCPHVYAFDARTCELDADPLSGALFRGAEGDDLDRLEMLAAVDGKYRIRIANEMDEEDYVDAVSLRVVDHAANAQAVPAGTRQVLQVEGAVAPFACTDVLGRDALPKIRLADGDGYTSCAGDFAAGGACEPREHLDLAFRRPAADARAVLVLRARLTRLATESFARYLSAMGGGALALWRRTQDCEFYPYPQRMEDEFRLLGLPLCVSVRDDGRWVPAGEVRPIGPAVLRCVAVPLTLPAGQETTVRVRLEMAPLFWEIDQVLLGRAADEVAEPVLLAPSAAHLGDGRDVRVELAAADGNRLKLRRGECAEVEFAAPPPPPAGRQRTVLLCIRGYYDVEVTGPAWLDPVAVVKHRTGADSLPRYVLRREQGRRQGGRAVAGPEATGR